MVIRRQEYDYTIIFNKSSSDVLFADSVIHANNYRFFKRPFSPSHYVANPNLLFYKFSYNIFNSYSPKQFRDMIRNRADWVFLSDVELI